jgi:allantoin racemase
LKLWYQSMSRQGAWPSYNAALRQTLKRVKDPDTEIEVHGITKVGGVGDQFRYLEFLATAEVLENVHRAVREGFDAFLIGNIADPVLSEAREIANIPVLGLCESALHMASMMGGTFSLVTINAKFTPRIVENINRYGLRDRLAAVNQMAIDRLVDLDRGFDDEQARIAVLEQFQAAARINIAAGAEVVIAAGGPVMVQLAMAGLHCLPEGVPILNGVTNLIKLGETAAKLNHIMGGHFTSKHGRYAPPPPGQITELRRYYGEHIYPTVIASDAKPATG